MRYEGEPTHYDNSNTFDFVVQLINPCLTATLTIDPSIMTSPIQYEVFDNPHEEIFEQSDVTSSETTTTCPPFVFILTDQQGNALPTPLFDYYDSTTTLSIETDDVNEAGTYDLRLSVAYEGS